MHDAVHFDGTQVTRVDTPNGQYVVEEGGIMYPTRQGGTSSTSSFNLRGDFSRDDDLVQTASGPTYLVEGALAPSILYRKPNKDVDKESLTEKEDNTIDAPRYAHKGEPRFVHAMLSTLAPQSGPHFVNAMFVTLTTKGIEQLTTFLWSNVIPGNLAK